jgi:dTDP-glucose 4,6-dehydratase
MAANSHVDRSITFPLEFVYDNVLGSANLFEYLRKYQPQVEKIINFSTDEVFGPAPDDYDFKEDDRFRPSNPYSASKAGQTALGHAYWVTYKLPVINTFTMNVFGERQNPEKLIPKAMRCAIKGIPMPVHAKLGDKGEVLEVGQRHWLHARNASNAVVFLLRNGIVGEYYNVVGDDEYENDEIVKLVNTSLGIDTPLIEYVDYHKSRPGHDRRYALDGSKLRALGWIPPLDFHTSVKKMVEWTKAHPEWL